MVHHQRTESHRSRTPPCPFNMPPSHQNTPARPASSQPSQNIPARNTESMARPAGVPPRLRNDGEITVQIAVTPPIIANGDVAESWIDISSQPSSYSLSSISDEIVTTGLRVQHDSHLRRRRRAHGPTHIVLEPRQTGT